MTDLQTESAVAATNAVHEAAHHITGGHIAMVLIFSLVMLFMYNLPWIIALKRKHPNIVSIFLLNFFFGVTGVGWIIALVMALQAPHNNAPVHVTVNTK